MVPTLSITYFRGRNESGLIKSTACLQKTLTYFSRVLQVESSLLTHVLSLYVGGKNMLPFLHMPYMGHKHISIDFDCFSRKYDALALKNIIFVYKKDNFFMGYPS